MLEKEFKYYIDNQDKFVNLYNGKYLVIVNEELKDVYNEFEEAFFKSIEKYGAGNFLLQLCTEGDKAYTATFHSRVRF